MWRAEESEKGACGSAPKGYWDALPFFYLSFDDGPLSEIKTATALLGICSIVFMSGRLLAPRPERSVRDGRGRPHCRGD